MTVDVYEVCKRAMCIMKYTRLSILINFWSENKILAHRLMLFDGVMSYFGSMVADSDYQWNSNSYGSLSF